MTWASRIAVIALAALAACAPDADVARAKLSPASEPAGQQPSVLDNPLHARHLSGTTPVACSSCHDLKAPDFEVPKATRCIECHDEGTKTLHGEDTPCTECHGFATGDEGPKESDCQRCHQEVQKGRAAIKAHAKAPCGSCHAPHAEPSLAVRSCLDCHEDHQEKHGKPGMTVVDRCSQCHPPHSRSIEAVALCQECHKDKLRSAVFRGHNRCETCHAKDRQSAPDKPVECTSCHGTRVTAGSAKEHADCKSCHSPHDPRGTALQSCRRCHSKVAPKHPKDKRLGQCLGCHPAHPTSAGRVASPCSSCHRKATNDLAFHAPKQTDCGKCHGSQGDRHDLTSPGCAKCHSREHKLATAAPDHQKCKSCHASAHAPKPMPASCSTCHTAEYESSGTGHKECQKCHEPHSGERLPKSGCEHCHADRLPTTHGRIDGGCNSCHRAHGPGGRAKPPACTSCHARKKLPGLHAVDEHGKCTTCHGGHGMHQMVRATCVDECHDKQVDHERVAKTCVGCHPFGGSR